MNKRLATAEWANPTSIEENYAYRNGSIWLGRSPSEKSLPLGYSDDRHVCLVSGNRGGKGTTAIVNTLLLWPGSIVVIDPKGENATVTANRRGKGSEFVPGLRQAVRVLDPFKTAQIDDSLRSRFNPLDTLDPDSDDAIDHAGRIADAIVVIHESNDPFWDESARNLVKTVLLHMMTTEKYVGRRNLITLRKLISRGDWELVQLLREAGERDIQSPHRLLWEQVSRNSAYDGMIAGAGEKYADMLIDSPKLFDSVLLTVNRNMEFIDSPPMQRCLSGSDFALSSLKTAKGGMSLYLSLPQRYMSTHSGWLRMMIALIVHEMEIVPGKPATGHQTLMLLDEFAGLKRMEVIENAVSQIAGYGLKMFFVLQSLEQLKAVYKDHWETFLANAGVKIFFNLEDHFSREYVSKLIGETEITRDVHSSSESTGKSEGSSYSKSISKSGSTGHSISRGNSTSEGTNWSASSSESQGKTSSKSDSTSSSEGASWTPQQFFHWELHKNLSKNASRGQSYTTTKGTSEGSSQSRTIGGSQGSSSSLTDGTSRTEGWSSGENVGATAGTSFSRTAGDSETIHRRPLIFPDEIGQWFASVSDKGRSAYPGLGLVLIAGQRPIVVRRVNYYEDIEFIGLFTSHPDHLLKMTTVLWPLGKNALECGKRWVPDMTCRPSLMSGSVVRPGDIVAWAYSRQKAIAPIKSSIEGRFLLHKGALFLMYYSFGYPGDSSVQHLNFIPTYDPFHDLNAYCQKLEEAQKRRNNLISGFLTEPKINYLLPDETNPLLKDFLPRQLPRGVDRAMPEIKAPPQPKSGMFSRLLKRLILGRTRS